MSQKLSRNSKKAYSSSRERDKKTRLQRLTMISSESSVLSQSDNGLGGSMGPKLTETEVLGEVVFVFVCSICVWSGCTAVALLLGKAPQCL